MDRDEWEEQILKQMVEMFRQMGMDVGEDDLKRMMEQIQSQFEDLGIDPEKIASGEVKINLQSDLGEMFGKDGMPDLSDLLSNLGVDVRMGQKASEPEPAVVELPEEEAPDEDALNQIPIADVYVEGDSMNITIDISRHDGIEDAEIELNLSGGGSTLQLMRTSQLRPFQRFELPKAAERVDDWALNNGILDITLTLRENPEPTPEGGN